MSYSLDELLTKFRQDQDDLVEPLLWSDEEIAGYLDEAQDEFCDLIDVLSSEINIAYVAATVQAANGFIDISQYRITRARSADLVSSRKYLHLVNWEEMDQNPQKWVEDDYGLDMNNSDWKDQTGEPRIIITNYIANQWRLYPMPTTDDTIDVRIFKRPETSPIDGDELEVTERQHQRAILLKARSLAYLKQDSETYDTAMAVSLENQFLTRVNEFDQRLKRSRRRSNSTSYGGIPQSVL